MTARRRHLFEFNDSPWAPVALRESIIESLSRTLAWGRILRGLVPTFRDFLARAGVREVLDLCSGAGGPAAVLADELARAGAPPPHFLLTDLQPHPGAWSRLRESRPGVVDFVAEPVDATRIPAELARGRARVIVNALHHFEPDIAGAILRGACENGPGIFVAEGFERRLSGFAPFAVAGLPALMCNPVLTPRRHVEKALLTWLTPVALAVSLWDGLVSTQRVYTEAELRAMVAPLGSVFTWEYGTYDFAPLGRGTYFFGVR